MKLTDHSHIIVQQRREIAELLGFETRNKYEIYDQEKNLIGYCAEQQKGFFGFLFRQFLGHWRSFEIHFYDVARKEVMFTKHPFRFIFQEFHVYNSQKVMIGFAKQRWGILTKKFDVFDESGQLILEMRSGFLSFWTFPLRDLQGIERALIQKKWSGFLKEVFLDADNFMVSFKDPRLKENERLITLAMSVFADLQYFERKS